MKRHFFHIVPFSLNGPQLTCPLTFLVSSPVFRTGHLCYSNLPHLGFQLPLSSVPVMWSMYSISVRLLKVGRDNLLSKSGHTFAWQLAINTHTFLSAGRFSQLSLQSCFRSHWVSLKTFCVWLTSMSFSIMYYFPNQNFLQLIWNPSEHGSLLCLSSF